MSVHHFLSIHLDLEKQTNCKFTDAHVNVDGKRNRWRWCEVMNWCQILKTECVYINFQISIVCKIGAMSTNVHRAH